MDLETNLATYVFYLNEWLCRLVPTQSMLGCCFSSRKPFVLFLAESLNLPNSQKCKADMLMEYALTCALFRH